MGEWVEVGGWVGVGRWGWRGTYTHGCGGGVGGGAGLWVFETATPSRDIWGDFNGRMASTFLVNLNELSKKETIESEGRIKALITDPKLTINNKG